MNNMGMAMQWMNNLMNNAQKMLSNPMAQNVLKMYQNHDEKGLEQMYRNMCKERGINADEQVNNLKKHLGLWKIKYLAELQIIMLLILQN